MKDEILYNESNDYANKEWEVGGETVTGEVVERVDLTEAETLTVPECKHENVTRTPSEEFEGSVEVKCTVCPLGWYERMK